MGTEHSGGRGLRIRRNNQQLLTNKPALEPVRQIVDNWLIRFSNTSFNLVDFQRPDRVSGPFGPAFKFAGLIQISHIDKRGYFFFLLFQQAWNILLMVLTRPPSL